MDTGASRRSRVMSRNEVVVWGQRVGVGGAAYACRDDNGFHDIDGGMGTCGLRD